MAYSDVMGELFIWTDIDPAHEADFNRWYDREHMAAQAVLGQPPDAQVFDLLWDLQSAELSAPQAP